MKSAPSETRKATTPAVSAGFLDLAERERSPQLAWEVKAAWGKRRRPVRGQRPWRLRVGPVGVENTGGEAAVEGRRRQLADLVKGECLGPAQVSDESLGDPPLPVNCLRFCLALIRRSVLGWWA